jgi:hypothetical protein
MTSGPSGDRELQAIGGLIDKQARPIFELNHDLRSPMTFHNLYDKSSVLQPRFPDSSFSVSANHVNGAHAL